MKVNKKLETMCRGMVLAESQTKNDIAHHKKRIEWLTGQNPTWSDGIQVSSHDIRKMLEQSQQIIKRPMHGFNSCQCIPKCANI